MKSVLSKYVLLTLAHPQTHGKKCQRPLDGGYFGANSEVQGMVKPSSSLYVLIISADDVHYSFFPQNIYGLKTEIHKACLLDPAV